jgi:type III secretion system needle length determinant
MKINRSVEAPDSGPNSSRSSTASSASRTEAEGRRDEFREAMRQGKDAVRQYNVADTQKQAERDKKPVSGKKEDNSNPASFSGDALLQSLGKSFATLESQGVFAASASANVDAASLATELAERVLVNTNNGAADSEVRITLKEAVLPDTEIILRREGERLIVQLASGNPASLDALRQAQEDLRNKLLTLNQDVYVEVLDNRGQESADNEHADRHSRGLDYFYRED